MIMLKQKQSDSTNSTVSCNNCSKNYALIKKYQQLIHLYKKKQVRLSTEMSSQMSIGKNSSIGGAGGEGEVLGAGVDEISRNNARKLGEVLQKMYKGRCSIFYRVGLGKSVKKLLVLSLANKLQKYAKTHAFGQIKNKIKKQKQFLHVGQSFSKIKQNNQNSIISELIKQINAKPQQLSKNIAVQLSKLKDQLKLSPSTANFSNKNNSPHTLTQLQLQNKTLTILNTTLQSTLQELQKRQAKQNQKKKQSLQMLAQQISQKNDQILQLKSQLKAYEDTYQDDGNVLTDDRVIMRQEIEHLERVREKLNCDVEILKGKLEDVNKSLQTVQERNKQLIKQINEMKAYQFQTKVMHQKAEKMHDQFVKLLNSMNKKLKRLTLYEKHLQQSLFSQKNSKQQNLPPSQLPTTPIAKIQQELKSQLILLFVANLADLDYKLKCQSIFDEEQKDLLYKHKQHFIKLESQDKILNKIQFAGRATNRNELTGIQMKGGCGQMDSIFCALESPRDHFQSPQPHHHQQPSHHPQANPPALTIKLLELELEKNKQVQKITQLKQKFLHTRILVLKLLKSLQLQQPGCKNQTIDILRVVFDLFQYSEEERDSIWVRKRKMFGFLG